VMLPLKSKAHQRIGQVVVELARELPPLELDSLLVKVKTAHRLLKSGLCEESSLIELAGQGLAYLSLLKYGEVVNLEEEYRALFNLYERKRSDYGDSFGKSLVDLGLVAGTVRIYDKVARLINLMSSGERKVEDETVYDTVTDFINYCIMTVIEIKVYNGTLLEQEE